jgi:hypothetical protein
MRSSEAGSVSTRMERAVNLPAGLSSKLTGSPVICSVKGEPPWMVQERGMQ